MITKKASDSPRLLRSDDLIESSLQVSVTKCTVFAYEYFFCKFTKDWGKCLQESISIRYVNFVFQLHDVFMANAIFQIMEEFSLVSFGRETVRSV